MNLNLERLRDALTELVKAALISDDAASLACREAARARFVGLSQDPPAAEEVRLDGAWTLAVQAAESPDLVDGEGQVNLTLPRACPFTLRELLEPGFDVDAGVERVRKSASTG